MTDPRSFCTGTGYKGTGPCSNSDTPEVVDASVTDSIEAGEVGTDVPRLGVGERDLVS